MTIDEVTSDESEHTIFWLKGGNLAMRCGIIVDNENEELSRILATRLCEAMSEPETPQGPITELTAMEQAVGEAALSFKALCDQTTKMLVEIESSRWWKTVMAVAGV